MTTKTRSNPKAPAGAPAQRGDDLGDLLARLQAAQAELSGLYGEMERLNRLAAMGTMAGMIAHEFNNILTPVLSYGQMALASPKDQELTQKALQRSVSGAERAAKVAHAILNFVRDERPSDSQNVPAAPSRCNLAQAVQDSVACLARDPSRDGVRLDVDVPADLHAAIDSIALQQALVNLILNARNAIGTRAGRFDITAEVHTDEPITPSGAADSRVSAGGQGGCSTWNGPVSTSESAGPWVVLSIRDSGSGMSPDRLAKLFQPFATDGGSVDRRGTGLGMVITKRLIETAGGWMTVQSTPGHGTIVSIALHRL